MKYVIILTTAPTLRFARKLTQVLLKNKIAACVTIAAPSESHFTWKGKKEKAREYLLMIKTRRSLYRKLEKFILTYHPYEVPEIIQIPIQAGSKKYLRWMDEAVICRK